MMWVIISFNIMAKQVAPKAKGQDFSGLHFFTGVILMKTLKRIGSGGCGIKNSDITFGKT